ncbi:hypothetical protein BS47DRAFT_1378233 [Hydnum rufescens UP504]|uniref:SET domain-containing protein n=1 Tax=Hydnum rufescens UP504 TaxID=1448309 RepID=A0A9P6AIA5_9AGAM|nr:hypothetical protein BS47DRAFT_1378233 [Hydnum rufescens UP504]
MSANPSETPQFKAFRNWVRANGGYIHPALTFLSGPRGTSVLASKDILPNTTVLSCPFDLAITRDLAIGALKACIWDSNTSRKKGSPQSDTLLYRAEQLSERQIVCSYIVLHWVILSDPRSSGSTDSKTSPSAVHFKHAPYINTFPSPDQLRTPMQFTAAELELLKGTNLYGATEDRQKEWQTEWRQVRDLLSDVNTIWAEKFTWDRYVTAATYLSSRGFPSSLLSASPTTSPSDASYSILLPILDCLNHARRHPVSWLVTSSAPSTPTTTTHNLNKSALHATLLLRSPTLAQTEVFNNYGPKPNSELLLGYGFIIPSNPEDTIVLKLGGSAHRHEISRDVFTLAGCNGMRDLWAEVEMMVLTSGEDDESVTSMEGGWEVTLEVCEALKDMVARKIDALPDLTSFTSSPNPPAVRPDVTEMIIEYVQGQRDILGGILEYVKRRKQAAIETAKAEGLDVQEVEEVPVDDG